MQNKTAAVMTAAAILGAATAPAADLVTEWDKTFPKSDKVHHEKVTFPTRFGTTLVADLYRPAPSKSSAPGCTRRHSPSTAF